MKIATIFRSIHGILSTMEQKKDIIILKGSGTVFCAGGDVKVLASTNAAFRISLYKVIFETYELITNYKKPYAVLVDGLAMGGIATHIVPAKYRVATERTSFSMPETSIGYFNDAGSSYFLPRLDNNFGIYMGMTGTPAKGFDMKKVGLATHFVESHKLEELETHLINCKTHEDVVKTLNEFSSDPSSTVTELDDILPKIKKCFSGTSVEEIYENLHSDGNDWARDTLTTLNRKSPMALKITHRSMMTGRNLALRDCFKMEMRLVVHHCNDSDFTEGVRALLVDKDSMPKWKRKSIYDVTEEDVERFFQPISEEYELIHSKL